MKGNENDKLICSGGSNKEELISISCDVATTFEMLARANYVNIINDQICRSEHELDRSERLQNSSVFFTNDMCVAEGQLHIHSRDKSPADLICARMKFWKLRMPTKSLFSACSFGCCGDH